MTTTTGGVIFNYGTASTNQRSGILVSSGGHLYYVGEFNDLEGSKTITDGHWHHVAATYDGTSLKLYVDGVLDVSSNPGAFSTTGTSWNLGKRIPPLTSNELFTGHIDEMRVYSTALTPAQLQADMTHTSVAVPGSLVAYYDFDTGTAGGNNTGLTTLTDRSSNAQNGTLTGFALTGTTSNWVESYALVVPALAPSSGISSTGFTASWTAPAIGTVTNYVLDYSTSPGFTAGVATVSPAAGTTSRALSGLMPNTTYYLRLRADKASVTGQGAYAAIGTGRTATAQAPPGNALDLDGVDDYVRIPDNSALDFGAGDFTVEGWVLKEANSSSYSNAVGPGGKWNTGGSPGTNEWLLQTTVSGSDNLPSFLLESGTTTYSCNGLVPLALNRWYHLAGVRQGNQLLLYVNGVLQATTVIPATAAVNKAGRDLLLGAIAVNTASYFANERLDEVRIWSLARTAAQIQAAYLNQPALPQTGLVAAYNFDQGTAGGSNTTVTSLTDQTGNLHDGTLNNFSLTSTTSNWVESYALVVPALGAATASTATGFTANWTAPAIGTVDNGYRLDVATSNTFTAASLVAGSPFAAAGTSQVVTGLDPTQTYYYRVRADKASVTGQGASSATGLRRAPTPIVPPGNALAFDGNDDYVAVATQPALDNLGLGSFTLEAWVYGTNLSAVNSIIRKSGDYNLVLLSGGLLYAEVWSGGMSNPTRSYATATAAITQNHWTHVGATWDGTTLKLYVNGVAVAATPGSLAIATAEPLQIGRSAAYNQAFNGRLDEVRIYNAALTAAQVQADMTSTSAALPASQLLYYNFDQGTASGSNAGYTTVANQAADAAHGILNNFSLTGTTSNWVESYALLQPTGLAVSARTGTGFTASWVAPLLNGAPPAAGEVEGYVLDVSTSATFASGVTSFPVAGAGTTSVAATGLANGTNYYVGVRAEKSTVTGQGAYSPIVLTHTVGTDAKLSNLVASAGVLTPAFATATLAYILYVGAGTSTYTLTPTASNSYTSILVNGTAVASGSASATLNVGSTATIVLTSEDGNTTATYTVQAMVAPGYFRSVATGNWGDPATWEASYDGSTGWAAAPVAPTGSYVGTVNVRNSHVVTVAVTTSTKTTTIESGGILNTLAGQPLTIPSGATMTVNAGGVLSIGKLSGTDGVTGTSTNLGTLSVTGTNALTVNGTLVLNTGTTTPVSQGIFATTTTIGNGGRLVQYATYANISMPAPTWSAGSTLELAGGIASQTYAIVSQTLQNLDVNLAGLPSGSATLAQPYLFSTSANVTVAGTLTVRSTGAGTVAGTLRLFNGPTTGSLTLGSVDGSGNRTGGYVQQAGTSVVGSFGGNSGTTGTPLTVQGSFQLNGGTFAAAQALNTGTSTLRATPLTVNGDFAVASGATFNLLSAAQGATANYAGGTVALNGNFSNAGTVSTGNTASTTQKLLFGKAGTQTFSNTGTISGLVNAQVNSGTILDLGTSAFTGTGYFTTQSGSTLRLGSPDGISASGTATGNVQSTGTRTFNGSFEYYGPVAQMTGTGLPATLAATSTLAFNNPAGVTLSQATSVPGTLQLKQGVVTTTATNLLTLGTGPTVAGTLDATASNSGSVVGPFKCWIPATAGSYTFPVGTPTLLRPATINFTTAPTAAGSLTAEFIAQPSGNQGLPLPRAASTSTRLQPAATGTWRRAITWLVVPTRPVSPSPA
ncbi:LamG-like jellyroll fold domain-containing protein [Hymenobacter sp. BRD67]|uniref:LamG-like jellyroll fold domain-containing protein n=1 Tax=Hymenobacter sp. BRD67 TaxID=2675877 RepID=UPI0015674208|nr:LamG-like jellyroll fold domain-containing protein [Hymenobacter sp. BRD67]QKG53346.1 fibronectin type III domain-containing protein [Hymenobacter sp. BRD67]